MYVIQKKTKCECDPATFVDDREFSSHEEGVAGYYIWVKKCPVCWGAGYTCQEVDLLEVLKKISVNISVGGNLGVVQFPFKGIEINE